MRRVLAALLAALLTVTFVGPTIANDQIDGATNRFRVVHDLRRLRTSESLWLLARKRVHQIRWHFQHRTDWQWFFDRLPGCATGIGENIAYYSTGWEPKGWPVSAWRKSPKHRENMLGHWHWQASAIYRAPDGRTYAVQLFLKGCRYRSSL